MPNLIAALLICAATLPQYVTMTVDGNNFKLTGRQVKIFYACRDAGESARKCLRVAVTQTGEGE